jgi:ubiquinone biosynthesis protein
LKTPSGSLEVVVKVQRPGIAETVASDLDLLHSLAALLERAMPETKIYSPVALVEQFDRAITSELDFTTEAENARRFARHAEGTTVVFPKVYRDVSSKRVITLEYLDGKKIDEAIRAGHDPKRLARLGIHLIIKQIFDDGFFHADPHPGNVLVLGEPGASVYGLLDLGMVGRLSPKMRDLTVDLMIAAFRGDYETVADTLYAIATATKKIDREAYRAEVAVLADRYLGKSLKDIELSHIIRDLVSTATKYGLEVPPDFLLVGKALMTMEGIGREIDPDLDVFEESKPYFMEILKKRYSPEKMGSELLRRLEKLSGATADVPAQLQEVLDDLRMGRLAIRTDNPSAWLATERLGRRIFTALVFSTLVLSGTWLVTADFPRTGAALVGAGIVSLIVHAMRNVFGARERR